MEGETTVGTVEISTTVAPVVRPQAVVPAAPVEISFLTGLPKTAPTAVETPVVPGQPVIEALQTEEKTFTQADVNALMAKQRRTLKEEADAEQKKQVDEAKLTEKERLEKEKAEVATQLAQAQAELKTERVQLAIFAAATPLGLDPEAAMRLIDQSTLEYDEAGKLVNAAALVKAVAEKYPGLVRKGLPALQVVNQGSTQANVRTDDDRRREYFGGGMSGLWEGGGVRFPNEI